MTIRKIIITGIFLALVLILPYRTPTAKAAGIGTSCTSNATCDATLFCMPLAGVYQCRQTSVSIINVTTNSTSIFFEIAHQNINGAPPPSYYCLGSRANCMAQPVNNPAFWTTITSAMWSSRPFRITGLKPARTYNLTVQSTVNEFFPGAIVASQSVTTLPAYPPTTSTVSDLGSNSAVVNWASSFNALGRVTYSRTPPNWTTDPLTLSSGQRLRDISGLPNGQAWGVVESGYIHNWRNGAWTSTPQYTAGRPLYDIDAANNNWIVASGASMVVSSTDGVSWAPLAGGGPAIYDLYAVSAPLNGQAFATGGGERIYRYANNVWSEITQPGGNNSESFFAITTVDGKDVWAVGSSGYVVHTTDGGATWTPRITLPESGGGIYITDLTTLDGQTLWACGRNGKIWRSTNGGLNWTVMNLPTTQSVERIVLLSPDKAMFIQGRRVGTITGSTMSPSFNDDLVAQAPTNLTALGLTSSTSHLVASENIMFRYWLSGTPVDDALSTRTHAVPLSPLFNDGTPYYYNAETVVDGTLEKTGIFGSFTLPNPDTVLPRISITTPPSSPTSTRNNTFTVQGNASDNQAGDFGLANITLNNNGISQAVTTNPGLATPAPSATWSSSVMLNPGINTITASAIDTSGNTTTATTRITLDNQAPTVTITAPTDGTTVNSQPITLSGSANDPGGSVTAMDYQLNGAAAVSITPPSGGSGDFPDTLVSGLRSGSNTIVVHAYDGVGNVGNDSVTFTYTEPTFTLSLTPSADQTVDLGSNIIYTVNVLPVSGFTGNVNLAANNPAGTTTSFNPTFVTVPGGTSVLTVNTASATAGGPYTLTVTGTSGSRTANASVRFTLRTSPSFTISASPNDPAPDITAGQSGSYTIALSANENFTGTVGLSISSGLPTGATSDISPNSVSLIPNQTVDSIILTVNTDIATPTGNYTLVLRGGSGTIIRTQNIPLNIIAAPDFSLTISPPSQNVTAGGIATFFSGLLTSVARFSGLVSVTAANTSGTPGITISPIDGVDKQLDIDGSVNFIFNPKVANSVRGGTYPITFTATRGSRSHSQQVNLIVTEDTTPPVISNISAAPNWDRVTISWETNEPTDAQVRIYRVADGSYLGAVGDGTFCASLPCLHSLVYRPLDPGTSYYYEVVSGDTAPGYNTTIVSTRADGSRLQFITLDEPDAIRPTLTVDNPAAAMIPPPVIGSVAITGSAADNKQVQRVSFSVVSVPNTLWPAGYSDDIPCSGPTCEYSGSWGTDQSVPNGTYSITITAIDSAGNVSDPITRQVQLTNDFTPPQILSGPEVQVAESCDSGECWAKITWTTDDLSTSQVDYGITILSCDPNSGICSYPSVVNSDDKSNQNPAALYQIHSVTLRNLTPRSVYHYRITSCNGNGRCTN